MPPLNPTSQPAPDGRLLSDYEERALRQALEESDERFGATFEQAAVGIAHVAPDGSWLRINQKLCDILGYTASALTQKTFQDITYPDDLAGDLAYVKQVLSGEIKSYTIEKRYFHQSGEIIWADLTVSLVRTPAGEPKYFISVIQDISDRKQAEASFKASEQRFRRAIINAPLPIAICSESGEMLHLSKGWTALTGYAPSEIPTIEDWAEKAYGENKDFLTEQIYKLFEQADDFTDQSESIIQTKTGSRVWQFHSLPLDISENGQKLAMGMAADVTDLKTAQTELAQKLKQQATIAQIGQLALSSRNLETLFFTATREVAQALDTEYCKILELSPDTTQLKLISGFGWNRNTVGQATVGNDLTSQAGYTLNVQKPVIVEDLRTESRFSGPDLLINHGVISGISTPIYQQEGELFGILGIHTTQSRQFEQADVDFVQAIANILSSSIERHQSEEHIRQLNRDLEARVAQRTTQLEDSNKELKAFTYTVSHDLRAPLRAMQGFAQALKEDYAPQLDELGKDYATRIVTAAHQMDGLILDLLSYSQLSRNDIGVNPVSVDGAIAAAVSALKPLTQEKQAVISVDPSPSICGDRGILVQVLTNLLSNAIKFVPAGTQPNIHITSERRTYSKAEKVRISVADNGLGIAPEHQQRIFNVFERLHGVETYRGTGIGLAIVKKGVARMGGSVGVVSQLGEGSQFWIELDTSDYCRIV